MSTRIPRSSQSALLSPRSRRRRRRRTIRRSALVLVGSMLVGLVASAVWLGAGAWVARSQMTAAQDHAAAAVAAFAAGDLSGGHAALAQGADAAAQGRRWVQQPVWAMWGTAPLVGDDVSAVADVVTATADLAGALVPVTASVSQAQRTAEEDGTTLAEVVLADDRLPSRLGSAAEAAERAHGQTARWHGAQLVAPVRASVDDVVARLQEVEGPLGAAAAYADVLPDLMGAQGPRTLLVVVQTPAEVRSLGGLAGLVLEVRADGGRLEVVDSYPGSGVTDASAPRVDDAALQEWYGLVGDRAGRYLVNATMVPEPAQAAALVVASHTERGGAVPDAVVLTDVDLLTSLLEATGPVELADGRALDPGTARDLLLHQVYVDVPDPSEQDQVFADAARAVMGALTGPRVDPTLLAGALARGVAEHRLSVWSPDAQRQVLLEAAGLDNAPLADPEAVGVFLNDGTAAKLQYFLQAEATLEAADGGPDGAVVDVVLRSTVPADALLPDYVAGGHARLGLPRGAQRLQVMVVGPVGGGTREWRVDGQVAPAAGAVVRGRGAAAVTVDLAPGQEVRLRVAVVAGGGGAPTRLVATPTVRLGDSGPEG